MKIEHKTKKTNLGSMFPGDVFALDGEHYMVTSSGSTKIATNAVHLVSGILSNIEMDREVQPINAKMAIEALSEESNAYWVEDDAGYFHCPKCGKKPRDQVAMTDYCPNCGADLRGENREDEVCTNDERNEVIQRLQNLDRLIGDDFLDSKTEKAIEVAINAVKYSPSTSLIPPEDDLISRRDAIDALKEPTRHSWRYTEIECARKNQWMYDVDAIRNVPSASRPYGKWIGDKCSVCGNERAWYGENPPFCPDCGTKMTINKKD